MIPLLTYSIIVDGSTLVNETTDLFTFLYFCCLRSAISLIHLSLDALKKLGFKDEQVFTTMEMRMKCGIGKCGRCNIGDKFVCKDGPVFSFDQLGELPPEY